MTYSLDTAQVISLLVGVVLPLLAGLVTKSSANANLRAVVLLALAVLTTAVTTVGDTLIVGSPVDVATVALTALGTFLVGVGTHFGLFKPVGLADKVVANDSVALVGRK